MVNSHALNPHLQAKNCSYLIRYCMSTNNFTKLTSSSALIKKNCSLFDTDADSKENLSIGFKFLYKRRNGSWLN